MNEAFSNAPNVYTFPFWLEGIKTGDLPAGGLRTVITTELNRRKLEKPSHQLHIISNDDHEVDLPEFNARILGADPNVPVIGDVFGIWFDEHWSLVHPNAYTAVGRDQEELDVLYQGDYEAPSGSVARLLEHIAKYGPSQKFPEAEPQFLRRIGPAIQRIEPHSIINWQDYIFAPAIEMYADELRSRGCFQTYHHHMALPDNLDQSLWGKSLLRAISKVDRAYFHTDTEAEHVQRMLINMGISESDMPQVLRFDIGIDQEKIRTNLTAVNRDNYRDQPEYAAFTPQQKEVVDEIYRTQGVIPHRFLDIGRCDPQKGPSVILKGVDQYLSSLGISAEEMRGQYRFFFVMELKDADPRADYDQYNFWNQYRIYVNKLLDQLQAKYPGVIFAITELPRKFIPSLMLGAHAMTGGIQDGSNLAVQEALFANAETDQDVTGIIGMGAGFAIQTMRNPDHRNLVQFVRIGKVDDVASAIRSTVTTVQENPGILRLRTKAISEHIVTKRTDTIFVRP